MFKLLSKFIFTLLAIALVARIDLALAVEKSNPVNSDRSLVLASIWDAPSQSNYSDTLNITVYRSPDCSCCGAWLKHLQKHGFQIKDFKTDKIEALKQKYHVPPELASCHTAIVDGYVIEGHVPADDIKRLLKEKPQLTGLTVAGMPIGTPGMEMGDEKQPFQVLAFDERGKTEVFREYRSY